MTTCLIALGGNVGDVPAAFSAALARLESDDVRVEAVSRLVRSAPMGGSAGGEFWNAAARLEVSLAPAALLSRLHKVETELDRRRGARWRPRTIDLDLVTHGPTCRESRKLRLPHPGCWWRRFVLDPLVEIAGEEIYPVTGETFSALRKWLLARPFIVSVPADVPRQWTDAVMERLGALGTNVKWTNSEADVAIRFAPGSMMNAPAERLLGVPGNEQDFIETTNAILTAAMDEPIVCETLH